jgi:alkyl hydroperoxide reductase subunit AhpC
LQENLSRFEELNTQVLGISVDSVYSHQAFAEHLGGLTFPLLADFHPKGEVGRQYGVYNAERGFNKRAIIIVDEVGIIRHSEIIPQGAPDVDTIIGSIRKLARQDG